MTTGLRYDQTILMPWLTARANGLTTADVTAAMMAEVAAKGRAAYFALPLQMRWAGINRRLIDMALCGRGGNNGNA